jgi:hypothetical protein
VAAKAVHQNEKAAKAVHQNDKAAKAVYQNKHQRRQQQLELFAVRDINASWT